MDIADVIGWKFNHQEGMSCRENDDGKMVITAFPGGIPSQADQDKWTAECLEAMAAQAVIDEAKQRQAEILAIALPEILAAMAKAKDAPQIIKDHANDYAIEDKKIPPEDINA